MSRLAPNLFQRRFEDLVELGRARLPALAPEWTDYNLHDPGITLLELLAWVAEAQLYSLSRLRRDQRAAYAALLGIGTAGTRGASGLVWPDRLDPNIPAGASLQTVVVPKDAAIHLADSDDPTFRPVDTLLLAPGQIERLETRSTDGRTTDHTRTNERGGAPFAPLGERTGRAEVLAMTFECRDRYGLFGSDRRKATGARWPIGVRAAPPGGGAPAPLEPGSTACSPLSAKLLTADSWTDLRIAHDSTNGLLTTGVLLLDLDNVPGSPRNFTVELRCAAGFSRPPSVLRIEPNVVPILQGRTIEGEEHEPQETPDWSFRLKQPGLRFAAGDEPVKVEVTEPSGTTTWNRCRRLADHGPAENVYELDPKTGEITFGNGVNGRIPPAGSRVSVTYSVSEGERGVARNRKWKVHGFAGIFGVNLDPIVGGSAPSQWIQQRREARRLAREEHALVSSDDITAAAKNLPLLEVARVWVLPPVPGAPRTGTVTLVAMRSRTGGIEPDQTPETPQWLEAIRRRLAPRMPLGSRLVVVRPRYVEFAIEALVECRSGTNPGDVESQVKRELQKRLALVDSASGAAPRQPGVPVTVRDVKSWVRTAAGVSRVLQLRLRLASGKSADRKIAVPRGGLPRWNPDDLQLAVHRPEIGRAR
jgi:hypothetical protein